RSGTMGRLLTFRDITEQRLLEAYRDEVFDMVVHDLRSPLTLMISTLEFIIEDSQESAGPETSELIDEMMPTALANMRRLLSLVDSLLEIAKLQQRRMPMKWSVTSIAPVIQAAADEIGASIREAQITLALDIAPDLPAVRIDEGQIRRVLLNLLDNAQRYTPTGGTIQISAQATPDNRVLVRVADSGQGIPPGDVERVFDKFHQAKGSKQHRGGRGTGLGLTFCWLSLQAHGERIWVEPSGPLSGACFAFTLPVAPAGTK
ncbi:MAG: sensor histidine kinase, partial [Phototrophicaceae bacterium]